MRREQNEQGLASIIIVGVLVVLLALITLGFAKIMNRAVNNSLNNQLSSAANYAAQSAINDAMAYIKGQASPSDVSSSDCTSLLKEPGMSDLVDLSGNGNTKITCLLVDPTPKDLMYQQLAPNGTQIIKATTSDAVDKVMFSWQASNGTNNSLPASTTFTNVPTWNNAGNVPVLRVGLYPVPPNGKIAGIESASKVFFLVPGTGGAIVTSIPYSTATGSVEQVACNAKNTGINGFTADYTCNAIIDGLYAQIEPNSYYYLTITPIYNQADVKIKSTNVQGQQVKYENVQTVIDATAKANDASKRLQERVDSNVSGDNISAGFSGDDAAPGFAIRSAKALCKQIELHKSYYNYILNDAPPTCNSGASGIPTVPPTLTLSITGNNGADSGVTRDSGTATPGGSGYYGAVYINNAATVNWKSTDSALSCDASGGWSGDKNPSSSWSGVTGTGSQSFGGITRYTQYSMTCKGPGGTTPTRTVTAWPPPRVSMSGSSSYHAGDSYSVSWSAVNSTKCTISSSGNEPWNQTYTGLDPSGIVGDSKSFNTDWRDQSSKSYTIQCWDASGRSGGAGTATWTVGLPSSGPNGSTLPPRCDAGTNIGNNGDGRATYSWWGNCPSVSASSGKYYVYSTSDPSNSQYNGWVGGPATSGGPGLTNVRASGYGNQQFCYGIRATAGPWGQLVDKQNCYTVPPPPINLVQSLVQGIDGQNNVYTWWTHSNRICDDGYHNFIMCFSWRAQQVNGYVYNCTVNGASSNYGSIPPNSWTNYNSTPGDEFHKYNETFGWKWKYLDPWGPGKVTAQITCYSKTFGNQTTNTLTAYNDPNAIKPELPPPPPPPPPPGGTGSGGGTGGGTGGGGTGGGGCFTAGTMVATPTGLKPIEQVGVGDRVIGWDPNTKRQEVGRVAETFVHYSRPTLWVMTSGGSVTTTYIHPFWNGHKWVEAGDLVAGKSYIQDVNGKLQKVILIMQGSDQTVYNLEIGNANHDYYANGFLVHNKPAPF